MSDMHFDPANLEGMDRLGHIEKYLQIMSGVFYQDGSLKAGGAPGATPTLAQVLSAGSDAGGATIANLGNDAANQGYTDTQIAAIKLNKLASTATTYTLAAADAGVCVIPAVNCTITVPASLSVNFGLGTTISIRKPPSVSTVTIAPDAGVVINPVNVLTLTGTSVALGYLLKIGVDTWDWYGQ